jgi:hypothetical protein
MRPACHEHIWPDAAIFRLVSAKRRLPAVHPAVSNAAMATTAPSGGLDLFPAAASKAPIPPEKSIGRS